MAQSRAMARDPRIERGLLAQLTGRHRRIEDGEQPLGWKLGFGVPSAMEKLGTSAPLVGYLLRSGLVSSGDSVPIGPWGNARLEPEIAVHMGADLPGAASRDEAVAAIAALGPAIELVDPDPSASDPEAILAANIFQRHVLLGPAREGVEPSSVSARVVIGGAEVASADDATDATGDPVELVMHVASTLGALGETLRAGEVVICGSVVPALEISPGDDVEVVLDPLGSLSVSFV
jgi:2-keto-4-pentenoate hydratase